MDDLMKENLKGWLAKGMLILAGFVLISVFGTPAGGSRALIPFLVPVFGLKFGIIFLIFIFCYCYYFNAKRGFRWIIVIWLLATPLHFIGASINPEASLFGLARIVTGNSCISAIAIGIGVLKGKL